MNTEKIENQKPLTEAQATTLSKEEKRSIILGYVWKLALLLFTAMCMTRVPFVGSYVDGLIDYVLGQSKYVFYPLMIFIQISLIFHLPTEKVIKSKKFIVLIAIAQFAVACMISGISDLVSHFKNPPVFSEIMSQYHVAWKAYFINWKYTFFFNNGFISGGILAVLLSYVFNFLSYVVLFVVALVALVISVFAIFNINYRTTKIGLRLRGWMIKKLGGTFKFSGFDELRATKDNQNRFKKSSKNTIVDSAKNYELVPFDLLPNSDVSHYNENFRKARNYQNKLNALFKRYKIDVIAGQLNVYTTFSEVCFEARNKKEVERILALQEKISSTIKIDHFNITLRDLIVCIEYTNIYFSKMSLKSASVLFDKKKDLTAFFGLNKQNQLITQDFRFAPTALIVGKQGSGSATLAVLMALSTCYGTNPSNLELVILNTNTEATYQSFIKLPHCNGKTYDDMNTCTNKLHAIQEEINHRASTFNVNNVSNIEQYNQAIKDKKLKYKNILVVISEFPNLVKESFQNNKIINDILVNGPKVGVYTILHSYHVTNEVMDELIYKEVSQKYILELETESESIKIFDNYRGNQLHGNGDCLTFSKLTRFMERIQTCNINQAELVSDIDIIRMFYEAKKDNKDNDKKEENNERV